MLTMEIDNKKTGMGAYVSPSVRTRLVISDKVICASLTGETVGDQETWDGEDNWE